MKTEPSNAFIDHLLSISDDAAAKANLRKGLGRPIGTVAEVHPHVAPYLPSKLSYGQEDLYYVVASLFATHPKNRKSDESFGRTLARLASTLESKTLDNRLVALLNSPAEDLAVHLRHMISLLKAAEIPVDWRQLHHHLLSWDHPKSWVQRRWARDFWASLETKIDDSKDESEDL